MYTITLPKYDFETLEVSEQLSVSLKSKSAATKMFYADKSEWFGDKENLLWIKAGGGIEGWLSIRSALILSMKKWCFIIQLTESLDPTFWSNGGNIYEGASSTCALCRKYTDDTCYGCPIQRMTGNPSCRGTPWADFNSAEDKETALLTAKMMYIILQKLFLHYEDGELKDGEHYLEKRELYASDQLILEEDWCTCAECNGEIDDFLTF